MGWDCTLHVVDESALARFVDRFLGRTSEEAPFDRAFDNAAELVAKTKKILADSGPETAGRTLGELAILYVSAETPHVYSRGFSLSLWDEHTMGAPMPTEGVGSVEELLGPIVEAYPAIRGEVPGFFTQNYCVGPFVRARDVPAVLAYVEKVLAAMVPGDRSDYLVLARVLRAAAARGMAYWEATDMGVAQAHEEWLESDRPVGGPLRIAPSTGADRKPRAFSGDRFVMYNDTETPILDASTFPPTSRVIAGYRTIVAEFTPWDTVLIRSTNDLKPRPLAFSLFEVGVSEDAPRPVDFTLPWQLEVARASRDAVLLFPARNMLHTHPDARPFALRAGRLTPIDLPRATGRQQHFGVEVVSDAVPFGDGSMFVLWDSQPYRIDGDTVTPLGGGDLAATLHDPQTLVTVSDDAIVGLFGCTPIRISRNGARETILPLTNAQSIMRGPDDALILREGDNVEGDALKIWWPRTREVTSVQPDVFAAEDAPRFFLYAWGPGLLVAEYRREWRALPWDVIAALPRTPEAQFLARHEKLVAKSAARKKR